MPFISYIKEHWVIIVVILVVLVIAGVLYWYFNRTIDASMLRTSVEQQNRIKASEGYRSDVYKDDGKGILTVGYGHTGADVDALGVGATITSQQGIDFFNSDLYKFEKDLERILPSNVLADLDQNQYDALIDFLWNTGATNSDLFNTYVDNEDWQGAADFLRNHYTTAGGHTLAGLITRRNEEANQIIS